jgi:hypothetical protein
LAPVKPNSGRPVSCTVSTGANGWPPLLLLNVMGVTVPSAALRLEPTLPSRLVALSMEPVLLRMMALS